MKKNDLLTLPILKATPAMMRMAAEDIPKKTTYKYWNGNYTREESKYDLFMRGAVREDILLVALYLPKSMRLGSRLPAYTVFMDKKADSWITYDYEKKRWLTAKLDRLFWEESYNVRTARWISEKDAKTVLNYLGTQTGDYWGILKYQQGVRADELKVRHRRETDPWDADLSQTPAKPKDWDKWVGKVGIPEHFIFYQYSKKGAKTGYCSYCEKDVPIRAPKHNKEGRCPCCRHKIIFKSMGKAGTIDTKDHFVYLMQRCKDGMMLRLFKASRRYRKGDYKNPGQCAFEIRRVIYDRCGYPLRAYYWGIYRQTITRWIKGGHMSATAYYYHDYNGRVYGKTLPDLMRRGLSRTGFMEYLKRKVTVDPERYFIVLKGLPQLEMFSKAGLPRLTDECLNPSSYDFREKLRLRDGTSMTKILGIDAQELKRLRENNGGLEFLNWLQYEKSTDKEIPDKVITWFCEHKLKSGDFKFIADRMSMVQIYNYLRRNMSKEHMECREVITTWADYLSMAARFAMDTSDEIVYRPTKLKLRHDELAARSISKDIAIQAGEVLQKFPHVEMICKSLARKYEYAGKDYVIKAPSNIEEIIVEGNNLHHCIANSDRYWERIERHESYLLFLRKADEPEQAYYTMEIEPGGTVRQIRTYYDRQNKDIDKARAFLCEWQAEVTKRLTEDDRKKAKKSRVLREQEFIQLRNDQVKIHTGHLAGRLLVEVLTADLMENVAA